MNYDDFVQEQEDNGMAHWVAELSNGQLVYQDDGRPNSTNSAWDRLARYLTTNNLKIRDLWLKFRSNELRFLPSNADGYYFCKAAAAFLGSTGFFSYNMGYLTNNKVVVYSYRVPELICYLTEEREISECGTRLILNK